MRVLSFLGKLRGDERGVSAVEYALQFGVVGVVLVGVLGAGSDNVGAYVNSQIGVLTTATDTANDATAPAQQ